MISGDWHIWGWISGDARTQGRERLLAGKAEQRAGRSFGSMGRRTDPREPDPDQARVLLSASAKPPSPAFQNLADLCQPKSTCTSWWPQPQPSWSPSTLSPQLEPRAECPGKAGREGGRKPGRRGLRAPVLSPSEARAGPETPSQPRDHWALSGTLVNALNFSEPLCCHLQNGDKNAPEISRSQLDNVRASVPRTHSSWVSGSCS